MTNAALPVKISRLDNGHTIEIQWDDAGHVGRFAARDLRLACACAECVEEMSGRPMLDPARVPANVYAGAVKLVGAYAVHFTWSDGHSTGIYPWERLKASCPCDACTSARDAARADTTPER
jgi:ATP-binding protein involved in chromosome partitioning